MNQIPTGELLRRWREHRGWSLARAAKAINVTEGSIRNYESGFRPITARNLEALLRAMAIGRAKFFASVPPK